MERLESVDPSEVPLTGERARMGVWTSLVRQAIADSEQGKVTVVRVVDQDELSRLRNGCQAAFRNAGFKCEYVVVREPRGIKVFLELHARAEDQPRDSRPRRPANNGIRPRIRKLPA